MLDGSENRLQSCSPRVKNGSVFVHFTNTLDILLGAVCECFRENLSHRPKGWKKSSIEDKCLHLIFWGVAHSEIGSAILKKGEITLYSQKTESRITNFKSIKYGLISEDKGLTHFFKVIWYAISENQCLQAEKWRLIELICMFSRWPPKSYRILDCC